MKIEEIVIPPFTEEQYPGVPPFDLENSDGEYARGLDYYEKRIQVAEFVGQKAVLDAACGAGQWMVPFALHNESVTGIDLNAHRLGMAEKIFEANGITNAKVVEGSILDLPFDDQSFDVVFCRGVLMFTNEDQAIGEFARVLRPGGRIHIFTNALGWTYYRAWTRGVCRLRLGEIVLKLPKLVGAVWSGRGNRMKKLKETLSKETFAALHEIHAARSMVRATKAKAATGKYENRNTADTPDEMKALGKKYGLETIHLGDEATYNNPGLKKVEQKNLESPPRFMGMRKHIEVVYQKPE